MENFVKHPNDPILEDIKGFYNSLSDLLYLSGDKGSGKSELVHKSLSGIEKDFLIFTHYCFKFSVIDDFLLNFYDTLREYSARGQIILKKSLDENFAQKVSYYFKNLDKKSIILIDNFEDVQNDTEILNFLIHLASFPNVKVVVLSRSANLDIFLNTDLKVEALKIKNNDLDAFTKKVLFSLHDADYEDITEFYEATHGYELYLRMSLNYIMTVGTTLKDFMEEYKNRKKSFEDFLILKVISLVPDIYFKLIQNLATISHIVSTDFLESYGLGEKRQVDYLTQKLIVTKTSHGIYLKDYIRNYFFNNLSVQHKISQGKTLLEIYENELSKSPKDRLLRLSRESIRKQMTAIRSTMPHVNTLSIARQDFSYIPHIQSIDTPLLDTVQNIDFKDVKAKSSIGEKEAQLLKKLQENEDLARAGVTQEIEGRKHHSFEKIFKQIQEFENIFKYRDALNLLLSIKDKTENEEQKETVLLKLAKNSAHVSDFDNAFQYYDTLMSHYKKKGETEKYLKLELRVAQLYRSLYRFENAREHYATVLHCKNKTLHAKALLGLAEVCESEHNSEEALALYQQAFEEGDTETKCETYFKLGLMYDDEQKPEMALEQYKKCIETSNDHKQNKFLSQAYSNIALIYSELDENEQAIEYFNLAVLEDERNKNISGLHFNIYKLAQLYRIMNPQLSLSYLEKALDLAKQIDDTFQTATALVDIGDIYYDRRENEAALKNYLEAKKVLADNITEENSAKIDLRIRDMKVKMDEEDFERILKQYEPQAD